MKIQKGDTVTVIKGSDRKKTGEVLRVLPDIQRVLVRGVNVRTIHRKPKTKGEKGSIEKTERPVPLSNVAVVDPKTKKPTRIGYDGVKREKQRLAKKSGTALSPVKKK